MNYLYYMAETNYEKISVATAKLLRMHADILRLSRYTNSVFNSSNII